MDDPLSADVDAHVDRRIFDSVLHPKTGLLRSKTVILVTHAVHHLKDMDHIILVDNGKILEQGSCFELASIPSGRVAKLMRDCESNSVLSRETLICTPAVGEEPLVSKPHPPCPNLPSSENDGPTQQRPTISREDSTATLLSHAHSRTLSPTPAASLLPLPPSPLEHDASRASRAPPPLSLDRITSYNGQRSWNHAQVESPIFPTKSPLDVQLEEHQTVGSVSWRVYWHYVKSCGIRNVGIVLASCFLGVGLSIVVTYWLAAWGNASDRGEDSVIFYLSVYIALVVGNGMLSGFNAAYSMTVSAVQGAKSTMEAVLNRVLRAPMSFHTTTPIGQVTARFSTDQAKVDSDIPDHWDYLMWTVIQTTFVVVTIVIAAPWFILLLVPLGFLFLGIQRRYLCVSREVQRITLLLAGPVYSHLSETVNGLTCLRAFGHTDQFICLAEGKFDQAASGAYNLASVQRWLLVNLQIIGNLVVAAVTLFAVLVPTVSSANMAVALSCSFEVTFLISLAVRLYGQLENAIISVERLKEYTELPSEASDETPASVALPPNWPAFGRIEFWNFSTRYQDGLPLALDGINLVIPQGAKVGICGRTGSGKSTLAMGLFRLVEAVNGSIEVDGVDIKTIGLDDLRGKLTVLPQDPVIFDGTIRDNLDPAGKHTDDAVWTALDNAHLSPFIRSMFPTGLQGRLASDSLSAGQAQLFCLARALLRKSKVLVLDEISASIDVATDKLVQATIRSEFADCTVLTVAHRIATILDSDLVLVLERGKVAEFGSPSELLADKGGVFYSLAVESKLVGRLEGEHEAIGQSVSSMSTLLNCGDNVEDEALESSVESKAKQADKLVPASPTSPTLSRQ
ncbi:hypothetical protein BCR44DRAFT_1182980 [Catenaria anguillulae PL171]|uniref:P-loop containing nucleoside triphosphate hydrolase protein n=1 Tax=Catenaria anguillulae PL171 TaxID=765915 RepID=A0A1Y2HJH3_9FUNG|nr:hypothetical protein BCR44DRAFT_1182980 [Catenaria anguillulae PL171]